MCLIVRVIRCVILLKYMHHKKELGALIFKRGLTDKLIALACVLAGLKHTQIATTLNYLKVNYFFQLKRRAS